MKDLRSPLAKARDIWIESPEGRRLSEPYFGFLNRQFLENRLTEAFIAGWDAREKQKPKPRVDNH